MPEISSFYGIRITVNYNDYGKHKLPHFHASYQDDDASYAISDGELLAGGLPRRQTRLVLAWLEIHKEELMEV